MTPDTEPASSSASTSKKPRISFLLATWFGLGYLPKAPGTWGSVAGIFVSWLFLQLTWKVGYPTSDIAVNDYHLVVDWNYLVFGFLLIAVLGVWASSRVASFSVLKDPQFVVIDEVSGQMLTVLLATSTARSLSTPSYSAGGYSYHALASWGVLLPALLFFRLFDILKPFPIRHLEKLPGGWGIMADDWLAGIYAALLLRLALHFNLL